jgi:hypothetical protein
MTPKFFARSSFAKLAVSGFCVAMLLMGKPAAAETYEDAERKSSGPPATPQEMEWYESEMQPAFRQVLIGQVPACLRAVGSNRPARVDLVFVVKQEGQVDTVYWKEVSEFSKCLEPAIRSKSFPVPPNGQFYFGIGFRIPPKPVN